MKYKLVALDLDGTLFRSDHSISGFTINTIKKLEDRGVKIIIATGRSYSSLKPKIKALELQNPVICYNGAMIRDGITDEILFESTVPSDKTKELIKIARNENVHFQGFIDGEFCYENETESSIKYRASSGLNGIKNKFDLTKDLKFTKAMFISNDFNLLKSIEKQVSSKFGSELYVAFSKPEFLEIMDKSASKALALNRLMNRYKVNKDEVLAIGDGLNDKEMLEFAGKGIVMINGDSSLKALFENTTYTNNEDGVAKYLESLLHE